MGEEGLPEATRPPAASPYNATDPTTIPSSHQTKTPPNINLAGSYAKICRFILWSLRRVRRPLCDHINLRLGCRCSAGGWRRYLLHRVNQAHRRLGLGVQALFNALIDIACYVRTWLMAMPNSIIELAEPLFPSIDISLGLRLRAIVILIGNNPP
jgi:hypothetical protein